MSGAALEVAGLGIHFGGLVALEDVSISVAPGSIHAIIGPNGAGKTTLLNLVTGLYRPTSGHVALAGQAITGLPPHRIAGRGLVRTFQLVQLFQNLSVLENIQVGCHLHTRGGVLSALLRSRGTRQAEREIACWRPGLIAEADEREQFVGTRRRRPLRLAIGRQAQHRRRQAVAQVAVQAGEHVLARAEFGK